MSLSQEESNFLRFYFLNLKIASKAVRVYFDSVHPPSGLANELANSYVTLKGLRFITKLQLQTLYPSPACNVRSEHFDSTLIVCLLRNMTPCESAPITGWDNLPHPSDTSIGADIARFKWYRNMLAHHGDGKLSPTEFSQYWRDLEGAILRLGGSSLLRESQSAQHIALDTPLTDILNTLRVCELSQEKNSSLINDLKTTLDDQKLFKEKHENQIQKLQDSLQKGETEANNLATKLSDTTGSIAKSKEEIDACKKEIEKNEERIEVLQEQTVNKQNQIDKLITQVDKLEIKYEQHDKMLKEHGEHLAKHDGEIATHDEHMAKHDEQLAEHDEKIATNAKDIDDIKNKQYDADDSSNESKRKRLVDDTKALVEEDLREGTFVTTEAVKDGLLLLKQNGILLITGYAGTGKSRISRHILHMFCTEYTSYKCIKLNKLQEWDIVRREDNAVVLLDDIFGETNCIYNRENDIPILDKVHAYVCKGNIKVMITIRDTVKRQCQEVLDSHRLFKFDFVDLSSDKYKLSSKEKQDILAIYMKNVRQSDFIEFKGFVDQSCITILQYHESFKITLENPVKGFPLVVYQFVHNEKYFQLGSKFFDSPTEAILEEINEIRRKGEIHKKFMIQYGVMVYTAINENSINPDDNSNVTEVAKIIDAIYEETIRMKKCHISDAVKELKGSYLVNIPNQRSYRYHHPTLQESVILSFAQIDDEIMNKIIPLLNWTFFLKMVKPNAYKEKEGEVILRIPTKTYRLLAYKLVDIYMSEFATSAYYFLYSLSNTEIFQQEDGVLLTYLLDAVEKTDYKDNYTDNMIRSDDMKSCLSYLKKKDVFLTVLLDILATKERQIEMFPFILQRINQTIRTENNDFTIGCLKATLIRSSYQISSMKDVKSVKYVKALLDIVEENKIPVLLDQNIKFTKVSVPDIHLSTYHYYNSDSTCVFLTLCIAKAYEQFNIPLLEYLLSRYNDTSFDVNLFLKVFYDKDYILMTSLSFKSLTWMIEKFEDQELSDIDSILKTACQSLMIDTLEYLAPRCKTFDAIYCLVIFLHLDDLSQFRHVLSLYDMYDYASYDSNFSISEKMFNFLFSKIDSTLTDLTPFVNLVLQKLYVPDFILDALLPVCLNKKETLILAWENANFHVATQIMEKSQNLDIQSSLSVCIATHSNYNLDSFFWRTTQECTIEDKQLEIVKYIVEKFGYKQFDLKDLCQQAYHSKKFKIIEWFVQEIDLTLLNVDFIKNSLLEEGGLEGLDCTINQTKLSSFEKMKVLKSTTKHYTTGCSTKILEIVSTVWDSTDNKEELNMEEIVMAAYENNCFDLLMWIFENCNPHISTNAPKLLMLACADSRAEVAKWVLQTFEPTSWGIDEGKLFISTCDDISSSKCHCVNFERISMINLVLNNFQIKPLDLKSGLLRLFSLKIDVVLRHRVYPFGERDEFPHLVVSILEKCLNCLSTKDLEVITHKCLNLKYYGLINWILENVSFISFNKQTILNKACSDAAFNTIKLLSTYFSSLDINIAIIYVCTSDVIDTFDSPVACLDLLWKESNHESIDTSRIVSTVCKEEYVIDNIMTWIFRNFPHNQIPINEVLISCCEQRKIFHVKYIFHEVDNEHLDINKAFIHACRTTSSKYIPENNVVLLVDFLFQRLHDKTFSLSLLLNELLYENSYDLILYFLKKGYYRNIDMKSLMIQACRLGHIKIMQWILANVPHKKLDIKSAFHEACNFENDKMKLQCVALILHYIQDINMFEIDTVLKTIMEAPFNNVNMTVKDDGLLNWIKYIQNIIQRRIGKSEISMLNTEENKT